MGKAKVILVLAVVLTGRLAFADLAKSSVAPLGGPLGGPTFAGVSPLSAARAAETGQASDFHALWGEIHTEPDDLRARLKAIERTPVRDWENPSLARAVAGAAAADSRGSDPEQIIELPPPPSGAALTLSGLLTLAGLQVARQARHAGLAALLNAAYVPDWYHTDAVQVGYSVPFEFQPTLQAICSVLNVIAPEPPEPAMQHTSRACDHRIGSARGALRAAAPRGPPAR